MPIVSSIAFERRFGPDVRLLGSLQEYDAQWGCKSVQRGTRTMESLPDEDRSPMYARAEPPIDGRIETPWGIESGISRVRSSSWTGDQEWRRKSTLNDDRI
jgi:hypothetical protein